MVIVFWSLVMIFLSPALGGNIKRMVVGAVSDIPSHNLTINPRVYPDTQAKSRGEAKPRQNTAEVAIQVSRQG